MSLREKYILKAVAVFCFLFLLCCFPAISCRAEQETVTLEVKDKGQPEYLTFLSGSNLSEDQKAFEDHIRVLLFISLDDIQRGIASVPVYMAGRRKFFSDTGWADYETYVTKQKEILDSKKKDYDHPQVKGLIIDGSQAYNEDGDTKHFTARVSYCYSSSDSYGCAADEYSLDVGYKGTDEVPQEIVIESWRVVWQEVP